MFRYHHLKNLPEYFTNYFVTTHQNFLNVIKEQIM
jgi:hypothetical protein